VLLACIFGLVTYSFISNGISNINYYNVLECESKISVPADNTVVSNSLDPIQIKSKSLDRHRHQDTDYKYIPASSEKYVRDHALQLGYDNEKTPVRTCTVWTDDANVTVPRSMHDELMTFREELKEYNRMVKRVQSDGENIRTHCRSKVAAGTRRVQYR
jgi:hypothetical protein